MEQRYCEKCGSIWSRVGKDYRPCDVCGNEVKDIPEEYELDYLEDDIEDQIERLRQALVITSPYFDQYVYENRDKIRDERRSLRNANRPKCPTCGSFNLIRITGYDRIRSDFFGGFIMNKRAGKTFECKNCGYLW